MPMESLHPNIQVIIGSYKIEMKDVLPFMTVKLVAVVNLL